MKRVIGVIGPLGAGKDIAASYIAHKLHIPVYQISDKLKELAHEQGVTREGLIAFSRKVSEQYGDGYLAEEIIKNASEPVIVLAGMRQLGQIQYLKDTCDFTLIGIDANHSLRFERITARQKIGDPMTLEDFLNIEKKEDGESVQKVSACMAMADIVICNEGTIEELYRKLDDILSK